MCHVLEEGCDDVRQVMVKFAIGGYCSDGISGRASLFSLVNTLSN